MSEFSGRASARILSTGEPVMILEASKTYQIGKRFYLIYGFETNSFAGLATLRGMLGLYEAILASHPANSTASSLPESPEAT